jgi:hypothetical protein
LYFLISYTSSKNMYATSWLNPQDALGTNANGSLTGQLSPSAGNTLMRQLAATDVPQQLRISGGYEFPFFRNSNKWLKGALGGWQMNVVVNYSSGVPVAAPTGAFATGVNPNVVPSGSGLNFNNCYINLAGQTQEYVGGVLQQGCISGLKPAWVQQPPFTLSTLTTLLPSTRLSRPPLADISLFKTFPIRERLVFQLRGEAFNVTNTPWFPGPNTSLTSPFFGRTVLGTGGFGATSNDPRAIQISARLQF